MWRAFRPSCMCPCPARRRSRLVRPVSYAPYNSPEHSMDLMPRPCARRSPLASLCRGTWAEWFSSALQAGEFAVRPRRFLLVQERILSQQLLKLCRYEGGAEVKALVLITAELGE